MTRGVHAAVAALGALYLAGGLYAFREATVGVGPLIKGLTPADVRYVQGPPSAQSRRPDGSTVWDWRSADSVVRAEFDRGSGRLTRAACTARAAQGGACPERLGIGIGTTEDAVWTVFGTPTRQRFDGDNKVIAYDDIGLEFGLSRFAVYRSGVAPRQGSGLPLRVLRVLVP